MFKIIGADQREYGPVSEAQIRQWISDRRLNASSRAQRATGGDWQTLAEFRNSPTCSSRREKLPRLQKSRPLLPR